MNPCALSVQKPAPSTRRATATNMRKKDARLLYIMVLASSRFAAFIELRTFMASNRDDFFANHGRYRNIGSLAVNSRNLTV